MTFLVVDNNPDSLWELVRNLRKVFPKDTIEYTHDPLMAGRFGHNNPVDVLFAEINMKRMDGMQLTGFLRQINPCMKSFLIGSNEDFEENIILDADNIGGQLARPVTLEALRQIAV